MRRNLSSLRTFYTFLRRENVRGDQPALDVELPKAEQRKPKVLRMPEVASIIKTRVERPGGTSLATRDRAILELLYGSGIRRAELADLNPRRRRLRRARRGRHRQGQQTPHRSADRSLGDGDAIVSARAPRLERPCLLSQQSQRTPRVAPSLEDRQGLRGAKRRRSRHDARDAPFVRHALHRGRRRRLVAAAFARPREHRTTQIYIDQSIAHLKKAFDAANPRDKDEFEEAMRDAK